LTRINTLATRTPIVTGHPAFAALFPNPLWSIAMNYKSIVVQLDTSKRAQVRLESAVRLARHFGAHLTGLFAMFTPDPRAFQVMAGTAEYYTNHEQAREEDRAAIERLFRAELLRAGLQGEWVVTNEYANTSVPRLGRCADLIIAGQDDLGDPEAYVSDRFPEHLVLAAGRPVLLIPYAGIFPSIGKHIMIAWDGSREATRAVHDALPLLQQAIGVIVVTVDKTRGNAHDSRIPASEIATVLARHGVNVEINSIDGGHDLPIGDALLSHAADNAVDLVVMGAYGHTRWQELILGGATRTMLDSMTVPVLMSH
jgi:nucleotide-binding universal stress UspA family protein